MQLLTHPNPLLRKPAEMVSDITAGVCGTVYCLIQIMREHSGVGLSANQIGSPYRLFVTEFDDKGPCVFINPTLVDQSHLCDTDEEGCLSLPGEVCTVSRPRLVAIEATNIDGGRNRCSFDGFKARVVCHELDHLSGILMIDKSISFEKQWMCEPWEEN